MSNYSPPLKDMRFVLRELVDLPAILNASAAEDLSLDVVDAVLQEAARFAEGVFAPTDRAGDLHGARWSEGEVQTAPGFREAYAKFVEAGWNALPCSPDHGGQGFPRAVSAMIDEMWRSANMALTGCIALTRGAIEAIELRGSDTLKSVFLPHLVRGTWTGTMNLTEPQAGSDLSEIRTRAEPRPDGTYRVFGQKVFISWGEHDLAENIVHLVLARTPGAPPGVKGISLFLVPHRLLDAEGKLAARNDVRCASIERKVGQHGAPSALMVYGEGSDGVAEPGAVGYLVGELHRGVETMFIMMNDARFAVGLEGLAVSERAYQEASAYARERVQGVEVGGAPGVKVPIVRHPDVRRMLMRMRSATEGMRALAVVIATALDTARSSSDALSREEARSFVDLMTPIFKAWNTETAIELTSLGVQVHGGLGYMEDCPASQYWKDARILSIYEGTTAIQANDLVGRKIARDPAAARRLVGQMESTAAALAGQESLAPLGAALQNAAAACDQCVQYILAHYERQPREVLAVATVILEVFGIASVGWQLGRCALAARSRRATDEDEGFLQAKIATARFFAEHWIPRIEGLLVQVRNGGSAVLALEAQYL